MKTDALLSALAKDARLEEPRTSKLLAAAIVFGFGLAAVLFVIVLGPRHDFMSAMHTPRFMFKFVVTFVLAASTGIFAALLSRPDTRFRHWTWLLLPAPLLLAAAVAMELIMIPSVQWMPRMMGHNSRLCMMSIPALSLFPLALILLALRRGAATSPARAGAIAGLAAAGLGAALYAAHCPDDSPLFVAAWYTLATIFVAAVGAVAGSRVLRW